MNKECLYLTVLCLLLGAVSASAGSTKTSGPDIKSQSIDIGIFERNKTRSEAEVVADLQNPDVLARAASIHELRRRKAANRADAIAALLQDKMHFVCIAAAEALVEMGDNRGLPLLRETVADPKNEWPYSLSAAIVLAKRGYEDGIQLASECLSSPNWLVRCNAIDILSWSHDEDTAYAALNAGINDSDSNVRLHAVIRLGELGGRRGVEVLASACSDRDSIIRSIAVGELASTGMCDAIPVLIGMLSDSSPPVAHRASTRLTDLTGHIETADLSSSAGAQSAKDRWLAWWEANKGRYPAGGKVLEPQVKPQE